MKGLTLARLLIIGIVTVCGALVLLEKLPAFSLLVIPTVYYLVYGDKEIDHETEVAANRPPSEVA